MSAMSNLVFEIQELLSEGYSVLSIADKLNVPLEWVQAEEESMYES